MPTAAEAVTAYREGQQSRPGAGNPYAGRRALGSVWAAGNREAFQREQAAFQQRAAERRRRRTEVETGDF